MLKGGDTVVFTYDDTFSPRAESRVYPELTFAYNFNTGIDGYISEYKLRPSKVVNKLVIDNAIRASLVKSDSIYLDNYRTAIEKAERDGSLDSIYLAYNKMLYDIYGKHHEYAVEMDRVMRNKNSFASVHEKREWIFQSLKHSMVLINFLQYKRYGWKSGVLSAKTTQIIGCIYESSTKSKQALPKANS